MRAGVGFAGAGPVGVPGHGLDAGSHERVPFARLDGVESHADGLQAGGAEPVDGGGRNAVQAGEDGDHPGHVGARFTARFGAAQVEVVQAPAVRAVGIEGRDLVQCGRDHRRGKVIRPLVLQGPLESASDRASGGGNNDSF